MRRPPRSTHHRAPQARVRFPDVLRAQGHDQVRLRGPGRAHLRARRLRAAAALHRAQRAGVLRRPRDSGDLLAGGAPDGGGGAYARGHRRRPLRRPMASSLPDSLWTWTATPPSAYPRLEGEERADVCIIGGGFTGLSAALHLAEGGASVVVLEAGLVGSGASGRNGGQVIPGLKLDPSELESEFGAERGARLTELVGGAADFVFGLVRRHRIECDARQDGWIKACHSESALRAASHTADDWSRLGAAVEAIDRVRIAELTVTDADIGGFRDYRSGGLEPLSYQ